MRFHFYVLLIVVAPFLNASFAREAESPQLPLHSDTKIVLNQVGYISGLPKVAMLLNGKKGNNDPVVLRRSDSGMAVSLISPGSERQTGSLWLRELNFSEFNIPGRYYLTQGNAISRVQNSHVALLGRVAQPHACILFAALRLGY